MNENSNSENLPYVEANSNPWIERDCHLSICLSNPNSTNVLDYYKQRKNKESNSNQGQRRSLRVSMVPAKTT